MNEIRKSENGAAGKHSNVAYEMTCANGNDDPVKTKEDFEESPGKEGKCVGEVSLGSGKVSKCNNGVYLPCSPVRRTA